MVDEKISVVVSVKPGQEHFQTKGGLFTDGDWGAEIVELPLSTLRTNISNECEKFISILGAVKDSEGYKLAEVEVGFEVSGEGGVTFIGTAKVGAQASLKMKFVRK